MCLATVIVYVTDLVVDNHIMVRMCVDVDHGNFGAAPVGFCAGFTNVNMLTL